MVRTAENDMRMRSSNLGHFIDAAAHAFAARAGGEASQHAVATSFNRLKQECDARSGDGARLPVCERDLAEATDLCGFEEPDIANLMRAFNAIEPMLIWRPRADGGAAASENFARSHANAMIAGPGGLEPRKDVWLGATLLAPHVRYPDHHHAPEEVYLVMSPGEFSQGTEPWFEPGVGGSFHNPPGILHAMRSGATPLLAFWLLLPAETPDRPGPF